MEDQFQQKRLKYNTRRRQQRALEIEMKIEKEKRQGPREKSARTEREEHKNREREREECTNRERKMQRLLQKKTSRDEDGEGQDFAVLKRIKSCRIR